MAPHWTGLIIIAILLLLLFGGRGKISALMGDFAKGITSFRKGLKDDGDDSGDEAKPAASLSGETKEEERTGS
ncbi:MAG: Sec-independent protein translocase TatA [Oceanicaulis sp.]|uniref:twin-arginine translocase TatA/TatE family subunit n=1 Tax=Glycocaulis sp. TaxID=1969725 RepID=UPI0025C0A483|nr:twin-arginine translocase TatA/TatE family subunit [Glycocaulis sp.]MCC5981399.1 Sec-independent protein translocase TatA [Oceanicaulis sp.]MCH8522131.1 twin-arginine translocase TatA/TatE family subunit [Glycocaulis sp.]